ncbi:MAG: 3-dehydroquinate synthase [Clostridiales bacterium]|nr:3-dehydroquinate synthase [Clostridiales bacterium]
MPTIPVQNQSDYNIIIEPGLLRRCGAQIRPLTKAARALIISDSNVAPLYGQTVADSLEAAGFAVSLHVFPAGEERKNIQTVSTMLEACCEAGLSRSDLIVALGGGVCGDLSGFTAAVYLRGIDFVQIPTTLLSQIDSSVGGKTGCDLPAGKNLAGAFHNPRLVLIDPYVLSSLPDRYFRDGLGEAVKYGCIFSEPLFERLERENPKDFLPQLIETCVTLKRDVVERDFMESGERMLLNFGHTLGHAIERHHNYTTVSHGEAVGMGMVAVTRAAEAAGLTPAGTAGRIAGCLEKLGLPVESGLSPARLSALAGLDKKRRGGLIHLVLLKGLGEAFVHPLETDHLTAFIAGGLQ